jgi:hypothetical protein
MKNNTVEDLETEEYWYSVLEEELHKEIKNSIINDEDLFSHKENVTHILKSDFRDCNKTVMLIDNDTDAIYYMLSGGGVSKDIADKIYNKHKEDFLKFIKTRNISFILKDFKSY